MHHYVLLNIKFIFNLEQLEKYLKNFLFEEQYALCIRPYSNTIKTIHNHLKLNSSSS